MMLQDQVAVVTGAGRGIGRSIALRFAQEGARVVVSDISGENAGRVAEEIAQSGGRATSVRADVTGLTDVAEMIAVATRTFGRLDVLVNNAGIGLTKSFLDTTLAEWEKVIRIDLTGVFLCSQAAARIMVEQRNGCIINLASLSGQRGGTGRAAYGAAKGGVTALTKVMSVELAPFGIRVNEIAPGPVNTEMTAVTHDESTRQAYYDLIPMHRYAERGEIAAAAVFLASADSSFVNGHTLNVDGGFQTAGLMFRVGSS